MQFKKIVTAVILVGISLVCQAQAPKDSIEYVPDSVSTVSVDDFRAVLKTLGAKITKDQYDEAVYYFNEVLKATADKRKKVVKHK